ncbi:hypothetical protein [Lentilactobacillus kribbianus]|uniref:hypothetical protein n=1 Tax=Lentilactobacillus kribbianus TaxID=2729622 RepID=UPI0015523438|nr:hypothetical protein [Lentilactobacillus kribbianus]
MRVKTFTKSINVAHSVSDLADLDVSVNEFIERADVFKIIPHLISSGVNLVYMVTVLYKI